jgi:hypothetical protein
MKKHTTKEDAAAGTARLRTGPGSAVDDARPAAAALQQQAQMMSASASTVSLRALQSHMAVPVRHEDAPGKTGLPAQLKAGIESLSGLSMDGVQVHYNSAKPAQLQAQAFAQGSQIHVAPGQEQHLPHEAWHVVQQAQGRVRPTAQLKGSVPVNDDMGLEREADVMGGRAAAQGAQGGPGRATLEGPGASRLGGGHSAGAPVQMAGHPEDLCFVGNWLVKRADKTEIEQYTAGEVPATAPEAHGPFYSATDALGFLLGKGASVDSDKQEKINTMAEPMGKGGKGFMMLANATAGMLIPKMRDLKMGTATADDADQERHGVKGWRKDIKLQRHAAMDDYSGSSERGYRDEDRWQTSMLGDNLDQLHRLLNRASLTALKMIFRDLLVFRAWLDTTKVVYVGMSVLVIAGGEQGKAVSIDFEHPIRDNEASYKTHLKGLVLGTVNVLDLVDRYIGSFDERAERAEEERRVLGDIDRPARAEAIKTSGVGIARGSINNTGEGNASIGDYDL